MSSVIKTVAVLGASGNVGKVAVPALLSAGFVVTIIARPESASTYPSGVSIIKSSYDDLDTLTQALQGQDALVEAFNPAAAEHQGVIVRAALAAGVKRLITPDFSTDSFSPHAAEVRIFAPKHKAQRELESLTSSPDCTLTWTAVVLGAWFDWGIETGYFWIDKDKRTITRFGSGNQKVSVSRVASVGETIVAVLRNPDKYRNHVAYFPDYTVSTNELIAMLDEISSGGGWQIVDVSLEGFKKEATALWEEDTRNGVTNRLFTKAYSMLGTAALFDEDNRYDGDFSHKQEPGSGRPLESLKEDLRELLGYN
ncbi:NAD(P)-binding protein [Trichoderma citrinoviride]|uniref:NAD(P)-binding protein n=1 Tax=Trichoderma citrinoviride TaxID=58853 RepID=A0A2T4BJD8_9HYPO|nr:NAD(P)-binding protein [Trichoderma citrinoviride]PTB69423.1 NAD(P)-binding protein [Trichoderma citrinoviride]